MSNSEDSKRTRMIAEFIKAGALQNFAIEFGELLSKLEQQGFSLCASYGYKQEVMSKVEWPDKRVRINLSRPGVTVIFDLLHEYGHVLDGKPNSNGPDITREISAWQNALKECQNYLRLRYLAPELEVYAEKCLNTYRNKSY